MILWGIKSRPRVYQRVTRIVEVRSQIAEVTQIEDCRSQIAEVKPTSLAAAAGASFASVFKEPGVRFGTPRLWRRAQFPMMQCRVMIALILVQVCDGDYGGNVMKTWGINVTSVLTLSPRHATRLQEGPTSAKTRQMWGTVGVKRIWATSQSAYPPSITLQNSP
jgi:hypothetical protein